MQQQERDLIAGLFGRLQPFETQPRDTEAEALIRESVARQPASPYLLVQTALVQEQALKAAQERIAELEAKAGAAAPSSFLGSAPKIGPWGAKPAAEPEAARAPMPSTRSPLQSALSPQASGGGGGFLRTALATAAGVAGGALLFEGIRNLMGSSPGAFGPALAQTPSPLLPPDSLPPDTSTQQTASDDSTVYDDNNNNLAQDDQDDDYDTASLDQDQDFGGSDDDSWA
jgi:hypothetical protein